MRLYGKNPVIERLKSNPHSIRKIYLQDGQADGAYILRKARQWDIPVSQVARGQMLKMARSLNTQGILAEIDDFRYVDFHDVLAEAQKKSGSLVFLDGLTDPQNLGAIIRSLACLGGFSIVLPSRESVEITEAVLRVASGADNFIKIARVINLAQAVDEAKSGGFWIAGAVAQGGEALTSADFPWPLSLVVGSEEKGIREGILKRLDVKITIPMPQPKLSFNVAHATTIVCYEIIRQKNQKS